MKKLEKLENPSRLAELRQRETLEMIGVKNDQLSVILEQEVAFLLLQLQSYQKL